MLAQLFDRDVDVYADIEKGEIPFVKNKQNKKIKLLVNPKF
jgi:hypothetical protein